MSSLLLRPARTLPGPTPEPVEAWHLAVLAELRAIRASLERQERPASAGLKRADVATLTRLLPAIAGALGSEPFASRDLPELSPGVRVVLGQLSVKQIGRLLSRAEGVPIDGWVIERCGVEINVVLWRVLATVSNRLETGTTIERSGSIGVRRDSDAR